MFVQNASFVPQSANRGYIIRGLKDKFTLIQSLGDYSLWKAERYENYLDKK
jgi:hypothetical protein